MAGGRLADENLAREVRQGISLSVNVSRIDLYDPDFIAHISALIKEFGIRREDFLLEITESAYTEDSVIIVENVRKLRDAGFLIEMDDFGSGYSSLNMISTLPIDVIKLDMQFNTTLRIKTVSTTPVQRSDFDERSNARPRQYDEA